MTFADISARARQGQATDDTAPVAVGRRTLVAEAEALTVLADSLGEDFAAAIDLLAAAKGRVVVTGMGKSGHIACKIAATFASTGTPAFFVHPAEASHGDLGMVTQDDAVIALSNSGETPELTDIIGYTRRFAIPLVSMTSRADSTLARNSDRALVLPKMAEACPHGLAPTTSTTMMMALGDALAVALLERKAFTAADFKVFHPGGQLGKRLLKAADLMHGGGDLPLVSGTMKMADVLVEMTAKSFGCVGVVEDGRLAGIITDGDLRRHMTPGLLNETAAAVMTADPQVIAPSLLAAEALHIMNTRRVTSLFVVEEGVPAGLLHVHDLLRAGVV